jgi:hypothetical protein
MANNYEKVTEKKHENRWRIITRRWQKKPENRWRIITRRLQKKTHLEISPYLSR